MVCALSARALLYDHSGMPVLWFAFGDARPIVRCLSSTSRPGVMRVSIITGSGAGIGAAVARRLAGPGQALMLHGQGADAAGLGRLQAVAETCRQAGAGVAFRCGDLAKAGTASDLVAAARTAFGRVDA